MTNKKKVTPINEKLQAILDMQKDIPDVDISTFDDIEVSVDNPIIPNYLDYLMGDDTISDNLEDMVEFEEISSENYID